MATEEIKKDKKKGNWPGPKKPTDFRERRSGFSRSNGFARDSRTQTDRELELKNKEMEAKMDGFESKIKKMQMEINEEKEMLRTSISNQVNWGIRTISYTSLIISLGLTMILAVIALTFKINMQYKIIIKSWELVLIIAAIFLLLSISYAFLIWWINKTIIHRKNPIK